LKRPSRKFKKMLMIIKRTEAVKLDKLANKKGNL